MPPLTKDNPARAERDLTIAGKRLQGATYSQLAKEFGMTKANVSYILNDEEIKEVIQEGSRRIVSLVPLAVDTYREVLQGTDNKLKLAAGKDVLQNNRIFASHTENQYIFNIFNQTNNTLSPEVLQLLSNKEDADVLDIELEIPDTGQSGGIGNDSE